MPFFIMGTAGHIDHGKTTLIKLLSGMDTDKLPEEKARGMSIDLGFAHIKLPSGNVLGIVDVPGHERFLKNMLAGVGGIDLVVLVIDVVEGIKPQTVEHTDILNLLSVKGGLIALNKADLVTENELEIRKNEIMEFAAGTFLENAPIIGISSLTGMGREALIGSIDDILMKIKPRDEKREFRIPIDRVFTIQGFGTIVTGNMMAGRIEKGEKVVIMPSEYECKIRGIQVYNHEASYALAGQRVALNLSGVEKKVIERGNEICMPGVLNPTKIIDAKVRVLKNSPHSLKNNSPVRIYIGTGEFISRIKVLEKAEISQGDEGYIQIVMEEPCVCMKGDHLILRNSSALYTVGGGIIVDPYPGRHKRGEEKVIEVLKKKESTDLEENVMSRFIQMPQTPFTLKEMAVTLQISETELKSIVEKLVLKNAVYIIPGKGYYLSKKDYENVKNAISAVFVKKEKDEPSKSGWKKDEIMRDSGIGKKDIQEKIIEELLLKGELVIKGGLFSRKDYKPRLEGVLEDLRKLIEKDLSEKGFSPDFRSEMIKKLNTDEKKFKSVEDFMVNSGEIKKITHEFLLLTRTFEQVKETIRDYLVKRGEIAPSDARDLLKSSRKYVIPFLEYLDQIQMTRRMGDKRKLL